MTTIRKLRTMSMLAATLSLSGCSDIFGPGPTGYYYLRSVNARGVPTVVYSRTGNNAFTVTLLDGELRLRGDRTFRLQLDYRERDAVSDTYYTQSLSGEWRESDNFIRLQYVDPETGDWESIGGFQRRYQVEFTLPVAVYGLNVETVFER